jgi:putative oxidoreductase
MTTTTATASPRSQSAIAVYYSRLAGAANLLQSPFLLLIRVYIGWQCITSGVGHLHNFDAMVKNFHDWNIPAPHLNVALSAVTEIVGGALLILGLGTRLISIPLIGNFLVAFLAVNLSDPHYHQLLRNFWNNQDVLLKDDAFPFLITAVITFIFGPGAFSVDGAFKHIRGK